MSKVKDSAAWPRLAMVNDTSNENHTGCAMVRAAFERASRANRLDLCEFCTRAMIDAGKMPGPEVDLVVVNGEGSLHGAADRRNVQFFKKLLTYCDRPMVHINSVWQSVGFMSTQLQVKYREKVFLTAFRESMSQVEFASMFPDLPPKSRSL